MENRRSGFSLLELIIYMAVLAVAMVLIVGIFISINNGRGRAQAQTEVNSNLRFAFDKIESDLRSATSVTIPSNAGGNSNVVLSLSTASGTVNYCISSSTLWRATSNVKGLRPWANTTALSAPLYQFPAVVYNGYIYTVGGNSSGFISNVRYASINSDGTVGNWSSTIALPSATGRNTSVAYNGYLYVVGGATLSENATKTVRYALINSNGTVGNWTDTTALSSSTYYNSSVVYNGYLYTMGGQNNNNEQTSSVAYAPINSNGTIGSWTNTTALPFWAHPHSSVAYNGYLYMVGGVDSGNNATSSVAYAPINSNGTIGSWTSTTALPSALEAQSSVVSNGYLYVIAGNDFNGASTSTVRYAPLNSDGSLGSWTNTTALSSSTSFESSVVSNGYLYVVGGFAASNGTSTVRYAPLVCSGDAITASTVTVTTSTFTRLENTNTVLGKTIVSIQADLSMSYNGTGPEEQYSEEKVTTVALRN